MKNLTQVKGIGILEALILNNAGIKTIEQLANYKLEDLSKIKSIDFSSAKKWIANAYNLLNEKELPKTALGKVITSKYELKTSTQRDIEENR